LTSEPCGGGGADGLAPGPWDGGGGGLMPGPGSGGGLAPGSGGSGGVGGLAPGPWDGGGGGFTPGPGSGGGNGLVPEPEDGGDDGSTAGSEQVQLEVSGVDELTSELESIRMDESPSRSIRPWEQAVTTEMSGTKQQTKKSVYFFIVYLPK
jgi:hypothetical protein